LRNLIHIFEMDSKSNFNNTSGRFMRFADLINLNNQIAKSRRLAGPVNVMHFFRDGFFNVFSMAKPLQRASRLPKEEAA